MDYRLNAWLYYLSDTMSYDKNSSKEGDAVPARSKVKGTNLVMHYVINRHRAPPVHPHSMISVFVVLCLASITPEPPNDKTNKMICAPSQDSDQPGHPLSLITVVAVRIKKASVLSNPLSAQQRLIRLGACPG